MQIIKTVQPEFDPATQHQRRPFKMYWKVGAGWTAMDWAATNFRPEHLEPHLSTARSQCGENAIVEVVKSAPDLSRLTYTISLAIAKGLAKRAAKKRQETGVVLRDGNHYRAGSMSDLSPVDFAWGSIEDSDIIFKWHVATDECEGMSQEELAEYYKLETSA